MYLERVLDNGLCFAARAMILSQRTVLYCRLSANTPDS
jgi:hypothetical protein